MDHPSAKLIRQEPLELHGLTLAEYVHPPSNNTPFLVSDESKTLMIPIYGKENGPYRPKEFPYRLLNITDDSYSDLALRYCPDTPQGTAHRLEGGGLEGNVTALCKLFDTPFYCIFKQREVPRVLWRPISKPHDFQFLNGYKITRDDFLSHFGEVMDLADNGQNFVVVDEGVIMAQVTKSLSVNNLTFPYFPVTNDGSRQMKQGKVIF